MMTRSGRIQMTPIKKSNVFYKRLEAATQLFHATPHRRKSQRWQKKQKQKQEELLQLLKGDQGNYYIYVWFQVKSSSDYLQKMYSEMARVDEQLEMVSRY